MRNNYKTFLLAVLIFILSTVILTACRNKTNSDTPAASVINSSTPTASALSPNSTTTPSLNELKKADSPGVVYNNDSALKDVYSDYFLMGGAINGNSIETAAINHVGMTNLLKKQFNSTTLSNLMKPIYLLDFKASRANSDGMPVCKFDTCDPSLQFCKDNGIKMRGHVLVWHNQTPNWFFYEDYDTSKKLVDAVVMERRMESYIKQVIEHCQNKYPSVVYCWDVVNEAINDNGTWREKGSYWYAIMKDTYIEKAFYYARKYADKGIGLFYNEYHVFLPSKRQAIYGLALTLKEKGLIDGLGLQPIVGLDKPELDSDATASSFKKALKQFAKLGLQIHITELCFSIKGDESNRTPKNLQKQADRYYEMMKLLLKMDTDNGGPCNITSVTVFGICDDYPLYDNIKQNLYLWDKNCIPKPCFYSYLQAGLDWKESLLTR